MKNIHITASPYNHPSRILKETRFLSEFAEIEKIIVVALNQGGEPECEEIDANRTIWRVPLVTKSLPKILPFQLLKLLEYSTKILIFAWKNNVRLVNVHNVALLPQAALIKLVCKARLVYDTHELETETNGRKGLKKILSKIVERVFVSHADLVILVGWKIENWYRAKYGIDNTVTILNCPYSRAPKKSNLLRDELHIKGDQRILIYQGGLFAGRGIEQLLEVFSQIEETDWVLVCMGFGQLDVLINQYASKNKNIFFQKAAPPESVLDYTSSADVGIAYIDNPSLNDRYCLPNKFFEYVMARLPVIVNDSEEMAEIVEGTGIGFVIPELTPESLLLALQKLDNKSKLEIADSLDLIADKYSWESQESRMLVAYKKYVFHTQ
ncbi:MAG: glycosyltransferase [Pseudomonadales bacterium]|nr:glycosyltransferase [Pseudomonadales bacterium]